MLILSKNLVLGIAWLGVDLRLDWISSDKKTPTDQPSAQSLSSFGEKLKFNKTQVPPKRFDGSQWTHLIRSLDEIKVKALEFFQGIKKAPAYENAGAPEFGITIK